MIVIAAAVMLGASFALSGPLDAAEDDPRLYGLFAGLRVTGDADEGARSGSNRGAATSTT